MAALARVLVVDPANNDSCPLAHPQHGPAIRRAFAALRCGLQSCDARVTEEAGHVDGSPAHPAPAPVFSSCVSMRALVEAVLTRFESSALQKSQTGPGGRSSNETTRELQSMLGKNNEK